MVAGMDSRKRSGPPIHSHVSSATIKNEKLTKTFCPSIFSITLLGLLNLLGELPTGGWSLLFPFLFYAPVYTLTPRFILKIRELYAHKAQDTRGEEIDNGFGLSTVGSGVIGTEIAFADLPDEGFEDDVLGTGGNRMDTGSACRHPVVVRLRRRRCVRMLNGTRGWRSSRCQEPLGRLGRNDWSVENAQYLLP